MGFLAMFDEAPTRSKRLFPDQRLRTEAGLTALLSRRGSTVGCCPEQLTAVGNEPHKHGQAMTSEPAFQRRPKYATRAAFFKFVLTRRTAVRPGLRGSRASIASRNRLLAFCSLPQELLEA